MKGTPQPGEWFAGQQSEVCLGAPASASGELRTTRLGSHKRIVVAGGDTRLRHLGGYSSVAIEVAVVSGIGSYGSLLSARDACTRREAV